jgi:hypothetical protein
MYLPTIEQRRDQTTCIQEALVEIGNDPERDELRRWRRALWGRGGKKRAQPLFRSKRRRDEEGTLEEALPRDPQERILTTYVLLVRRPDATGRMYMEYRDPVLSPVFCRRRINPETRENGANGGRRKLSNAVRYDDLPDAGDPDPLVRTARRPDDTELIVDMRDTDTLLFTKTHFESLPEDFPLGQITREQC